MIGTVLTTGDAGSAWGCAGPRCRRAVRPVIHLREARQIRRRFRPKPQQEFRRSDDRAMGRDEKRHGDDVVTPRAVSLSTAAWMGARGHAECDLGRPRLVDPLRHVGDALVPLRLAAVRQQQDAGQAGGLRRCRPGRAGDDGAAASRTMPLS